MADKNTEPNKSECLMFACKVAKRCVFPGPDSCDERGFITRRRDRTPEEQRAVDEERLKDLE